LIEKVAEKYSMSLLYTGQIMKDVEMASKYSICYDFLYFLPRWSGRGNSLIFHSFKPAFPCTWRSFVTHHSLHSFQSRQTIHLTSVVWFGLCKFSPMEKVQYMLNIILQQKIPHSISFCLCWRRLGFHLKFSQRTFAKYEHEISSCIANGLWKYLYGSHEIISIPSLGAGKLGFRYI
jgi:hypothetical protein